MLSPSLAEMAEDAGRVGTRQVAYSSQDSSSPGDGRQDCAPWLLGGMETLHRAQLKKFFLLRYN